MNTRKTFFVVCSMILTVALFSFGVTAEAQTLTTLAFFNATDGAQPNAPLVQGVDGNFYGTTEGGGDNYGVIFKITAGGTLTTLHIFHGSDGADPNWIVQGTDGNLYGTTFGSTTSQGTVFKITPAGALTTIARFYGVNGSLPNGLVQGADGNFYGTTLYGGNSSCSSGCGVVFKVTPQGILSKLHTFGGGEGNEPYAVPVQGTDGNFYGTTRGGGNHYLGSVYKITPQGVFTVLHSFAGTDGATPIPGLVQASDGDFYGTTLRGGSAYDDGTLYKITVDGTFTTLLDLNDIVFNPNALIRATDGNLYGSAGANSNNAGSLFMVTEDGNLTVLHSFNGLDGDDPRAALVQGTDGKFYGATYFGGASFVAQGSIFSFSMGLDPFVKILNTSGKAGASVILLGNGLTGTTSVSFNGTAAAFTVVSASEITATVPSGATSGTVQVTTPNGILNSNVPFQVTP